MTYDNPLIGSVLRVLKTLLILGFVLVVFVLTSFVGVGLLLAWLTFRMIRHWRQPTRPTHGPQVFEGEFEVVRRPAPPARAELDWPQPFDSTRPG